MIDLKTNLVIKQATKDDWLVWKTLRLEALQNDPETFGGSYEETFKATPLELQEDLTRDKVFIVYVNNVPAGSVGLSQSIPLKLSHRGSLFSLYVSPKFRRQQLASKLLETIIEQAKKSNITLLTLGVLITSTGAIEFYQKYGFVIYGTLAYAMKVGETYYDIHLMSLKL